MNVKPVSFGNVYAVYGTNKQITETYNRIRHDLSENSSIRLIDATDIYKKNKGCGVLTSEAKKGRDISFIVTGKTDNDNIKFMEHGWTSINGISHHIKKAFFADNILDKDIKEIRDSVQFD